MRRIDGHTHVTPTADLTIETNLASHDIGDLTQQYADRIGEAAVEHAVVIPLDVEIIRDQTVLRTMLDVRDAAGCFSIVFLIDPLAEDAFEQVERVDESNGLGVKLHPYVQRIGREEHIPRIRDVLAEVDHRDLLTIIDCSYGAEHMYEVNGVRLGHALAEDVSSPIILAHGGGAKIHEAFLTADTFQNIYLDTSFSIPYWSGSSVSDDFAFAMEKMDMDRWVWGTDRPFATHQESVEATERLLSDHGLSDKGAKLFYENMRSLLESRGVDLDG